MTKARIFFVVFLFLAITNCTDKENEGFFVRPAGSTASPKAPNSNIILRYMPDIEAHCHDKPEKQKQYLNGIAREDHPDHPQTIYWAGVSYCAYISRDFRRYREHLGMMIASSINTKKSNSVSEIVFSFIDNGRYTHPQMCSLSSVSEQLAIDEDYNGLRIKPYKRYGEVRTLNDFFCKQLDIEAMRRLKR